MDEHRENVLLIDHITLKAWLQPGGHYEAPGDLLVSALREVEEEIGLLCNAVPLPNGGDSLLDIDTHAIPANPRKAEGAHWHHDFVYLLQAAPDQKLTAQIAEVHAVKWVSLHELQKMGTKRFTRMLYKAKTPGTALGLFLWRTDSTGSCRSR